MPCPCSKAMPTAIAQPCLDVQRKTWPKLGYEDFSKYDKRLSLRARFVWHRRIRRLAHLGESGTGTRVRLRPQPLLVGALRLARGSVEPRCHHICNLADVA